MPSLERDSNRMVIAGASTLLGTELKSLLEESRFAGWDLRLVDEDLAAGTLTEARGEPLVIQPVDEDTFRGARFAFLACSLEFAKRCTGPAHSAGATVIDFSHLAFSDPEAAPWFPGIAALTGRQFSKTLKTYAVLSAAGTAIASVAMALRKRRLVRMIAVVNQSVSEAGRAGVEEMEGQASRLLTFQSIGNEVFGVQTAFNTLPRYGAESKVDLQRNGRWIQSEVAAVLGEGHGHLVSVQAVHAPVFYGTTLSLCADLQAGTNADEIAAACKEAGVAVMPQDAVGPGNVTVAGEAQIHFSKPNEDANRPGTWWFWGAADNLRVPAASAIKLAETLA
ncbi:MAG: aspartate-semialdehyde dehydrogenase [Candidatus Acidiferrum sp.]